MEKIELYNLNKKVSGILSPFYSPVIKLKINIGETKIPIEALIDTGAYKFHITPQFAQVLNLKPIAKTNGFYPLAGLSETKLFEISFTIDGLDFNFKEEFAELPYSFQFPLILGSGFLSRCKEFHYSSVDKTFELFL